MMRLDDRHWLMKSFEKATTLQGACVRTGFSREDVYRELCAAEYRGELIRTHKDGKTYWVRKCDRRGY